MWYCPGVYTSQAKDAKVNKATTACMIQNHVNVLGPPYLTSN